MSDIEKLFEQAAKLSRDFANRLPSRPEELNLTQRELAANRTTEAARLVTDTEARLRAEKTERLRMQRLQRERQE